MGRRVEGITRDYTMEGAMAVLWFVKHGMRPNNDAEPGLEISMAELVSLFGDVTPKWLGTLPRSVAPTAKSSVYTVAEVVEADERRGRFPWQGFYLLEALDPARAESIVHRYRESRDAIGSPQL
jgi:hypothetical protein